MSPSVRKGFRSVGDRPARVLQAATSCYSCHQKNAATQTTFVQFYLTAKLIAVKAGNFDASR